jgi:hypothetical protein
MNLPAHYPGALRTVLRVAIVMAFVGLLIGVAFQESAKNPPFAKAPAGLHLEAVLPLALVHGHVFVMAVLVPLALAGALLIALRIGAAPVSRRSLRWLTHGYLPFAVASVVLMLVKGYDVLLAVRHGQTDFAAIDDAFLGGHGVVRYAVYAIAHAGMGVTLGVFLVALWRSLGRQDAR